MMPTPEITGDLRGSQRSASDHSHPHSHHSHSLSSQQHQGSRHSSQHQSRRTSPSLEVKETGSANESRGSRKSRGRRRSHSASSSSSGGSKSRNHPARRSSSSSSSLSSTAHSEKGGDSVVNRLKQYLTNDIPDSSNDSEQEILKTFGAEKGAGVKASVMRVRYSKVPRTDKQPKWLYPYATLNEKAASYRGYPIEGAKALKNKKRWKIQIVGAAVGTPPEPLPQFPQQEVLYYRAGDYRGGRPLDLTQKDVNNNSGRAFLRSDAKPPTSSFFYTSGYHPGSAQRVKKPFPESIYDAVVTGTAVQVAVGEMGEEEFESQGVTGEEAYSHSSYSRSSSSSSPSSRSSLKNAGGGGYPQVAVKA